VIRDGPTIVARLDVGTLAEAPVYVREPRPSEEMLRHRRMDLAALPDTRDPSADLLRLLASPNVASRRLVYRQYDHQVGTNTVVLPGEGDAAVLRIRGTARAIAVATDGNGRIAALDPFAGGAAAVAEACRNVVCAGGEPVALTDCLNFGNPERPEVYYQLSRAIDGMAEASRALGAPVVSGNVSLYNESGGTAVHPTPVVGALGLLEDVSHATRKAFAESGCIVYLLGTPLRGDPSLLAASEYLNVAGHELGGQPAIDLDLEARLQRCTLAAIRSGLVRAAHDCSEGGVAVALAEACIAGGLGLDASSVVEDDRIDAFWFGEGQSRIVMAIESGDEVRLSALAMEHDVPLSRLGVVGGDRLRLGSRIHLSLATARAAYERGLEQALATVEAGVA
ncbi:MAG TPA: AIR synthase related protein, partial [Dehalococcoidia bacterium]|nr:AIR synthase related protein [Dehalococcoidia bacterium]